jgi:hypothetical protein
MKPEKINKPWKIWGSNFLILLLVIIIPNISKAESLKIYIPSYEGEELESVRLWEKSWVGKKIDSTNVDGVKEFLPDSLYEKIKNPQKWGEYWFTITPYKQCRLSPGFDKATEKYYGQPKAGPEETLHNWTAGQPFPNPKNATEMAWNFDCTTHGDTEDYLVYGWVVDGRRQTERVLGRVVVQKLFFYGRTNLPPIPEYLDNPNGYRRGLLYEFVYPPDMFNVSNISLRYIDTTKEDDSWAYIPSMRRVRRMSTAQRSDSVGGGDNTWDDSWGWDGHIRRNTYKLVGRKEVLMGRHVVPGDNSIEEVLKTVKREKKSLLFSGLQRERIKCYVIEFLNKDPNYIHPKRVCYIDPETWRMPYEDQYDQEGRLWKTTEFTFTMKETELGDFDVVVNANTVDMQRIHSTPSLNSGLTPNTEISENIFTPDYLWKKGR